MTCLCACANEQLFRAHRFTGKERDSESGNDYFGARYYASTMGRFMSPDWSAKAEPVPYAKLDDPQSLNLYAYVGNNPLRTVDPDGHQDDSCKTKPDLCRAIRDAVSSGHDIQDGYANWKQQSSVKDKPPQQANVVQKTTGVIDLSGDFMYYGNYGGPGWTGGQTTPYEDLSKDDQKKLPALKDAQDTCYQGHDKCYSTARILNGGTSALAASQTKDQKLSQQNFTRGCDAVLSMCLRSVNSGSQPSGRNMHSEAAEPVFSIKEMWPW